MPGVWLEEERENPDGTEGFCVYHRWIYKRNGEVKMWEAVVGNSPVDDGYILIVGSGETSYTYTMKTWRDVVRRLRLINERLMRDTDSGRTK